jgi:indolepyruvate ferredoxin oxidoreductase, beta subunit
VNCDVVLCGVGGQGVLSTAYLIDHSAVDAGLYFKQPEVHGMAQRGGAVSAQVRISDAPVASDLISEGEASLIISVEPMESLRYAKLLSTDGWVVTDVTPLQNIGDYPDLRKLYEVLFNLPHLLVVDATRLAAKAGAMKAQNVVVLGAAASHLPLAAAALERHIAGLFAPKGERVVAANLRAFRMGTVASGFSAALVQRGVQLAIVARVVARLDFAATPVPDGVVKAWADRLVKPDGPDVAARVFGASELWPIEAHRVGEAGPSL